MGKGIELSEKYGVNPTLGVCFFCGEDTGEIGLVGRYRKGVRGGDYEAPRRSVLSYVPCDKCKEKFKDKLLVISVTDRDPGDRPMIQKGVYPTGGFALINPDVVNNDDPRLKAGGTALMMETEFYEMIDQKGG